MAEPNHLLQLAAAVIILAAYLLLQIGALPAASRRFALLNLIGAGLLAWEAGRTGQPGFLLLEGCWALISAAALARALGRRGTLPVAQPAAAGRTDGGET